MISIHPGRGGRGPASLRALAAAVALAATSATAALAPGVAHAGTYPMYACDVPGINLPAPSRAAWVNYNTAGTINTFDDCKTLVHGSVSFRINSGGYFPQSTGVGLQLQIPATGAASSISIARVVDWTRLDLTAQGPNQAPAYGLNTGTVNGNITTPPGGDTTGWTGSATSGPGHDSGPLPADTKLRQIGAFCGFWGGAYNNCTLPSPFMTIRGLKTTLAEGAQPTASIDGGSLTGGGALKGTKTVAYTAADAESGVEKVEVTLDGAVVATDSFARDLTLPVEQQSGDCTYDALRACPATHSGLIGVDTTKVPDGAYELGVRTTDAAGNSRTALAAEPVVIDNVVDQPTPSSPTPVIVLPPAGHDGANGQNGGPGRPGTVTVLTLNGANASASASLKATFAATHRGVLTSAYGKKVLITGQLVSPSARPITGARLSVMQQDKLVGAKMVPAAEVVTDATGKFVYTTTAVRSRTIRFGYRAHLEDTAFSSTTDISLGVIARLSLSASPRALRNGHVVVFRGSVAGAPRGVRKVIELQVKKGSRWMTFRSTRLRNGRFSERYRFTRTRGRVTYVFRARVREEVGFPFLTSHSRSVKVAVRG
jgi:hypothetical protein